MTDLYGEPEFTPSRPTPDDPFGELTWNWGHRIGPGPDKSMYDRLGPAAVRIIVDQLYARVFADRVLVAYFVDLTPRDAEHLKRHQVFMLGQVLGGPVVYLPDDLVEAHRRLARPVTGYAYDRWGGHLLQALIDLGVEADIRAHVEEALGTWRPLLVADKPPAASSGG